MFGIQEGKIPQPRGARNIQQLVRSPRKAHSEKPTDVIEAITKMFPTQERIELLARRETKDWSVWGLDIMMKSNNGKVLDSHQTTVLHEPQKLLFLDNDLV